MNINFRIVKVRCGLSLNATGIFIVATVTKDILSWAISFSLIRSKGERTSSTSMCIAQKKRALAQTDLLIRVIIYF